MAHTICTRCWAYKLPHEDDWVRSAGLWFCGACQDEVKRLMDVSEPSGVAYSEGRPLNSRVPHVTDFV